MSLSLCWALVTLRLTHLKSHLTHCRRPILLQLIRLSNTGCSGNLPTDWHVHMPHMVKRQARKKNRFQYQTYRWMIHHAQERVCCFGAIMVHGAPIWYSSGTRVGHKSWLGEQAVKKFHWWIVRRWSLGKQSTRKMGVGYKKGVATKAEFHIQV